MVGRDVNDGRVKKRRYLDQKLAYVVLAEGKFVYPEVESAFFSKEQLQKHMRGVDDIKDFEKSKKDPKKKTIKRTVSRFAPK